MQLLDTNTLILEVFLLSIHFVKIGVLELPFVRQPISLNHLTH